jgi:hypothetical protein
MGQYKFRRGTTVTVGALKVYADDTFFIQRKIAKVTVDLDTGDAETALALAIPFPARILAWGVAFDTAAAGIDSTTGTLALTGGSTATLGTVSAFTAGLMGGGMTDLSAASMLTTAETNGTFTLSGGADNIPSAGTVVVSVVYDTVS